MARCSQPIYQTGAQLFHHRTVIRYCDYKPVLLYAACRYIMKTAYLLSLAVLFGAKNEISGHSSFFSVLSLFFKNISFPFDSANRLDFIIFRPHIMWEENHNLCCVFFSNSAKSPRSPSLDYFNYLTISITSQVTKIAMLIKVNK